MNCNIPKFLVKFCLIAPPLPQVKPHKFLVFFIFVVVSNFSFQFYLFLLFVCANYLVLIIVFTINLVCKWLEALNFVDWFVDIVLGRKMSGESFSKPLAVRTMVLDANKRFFFLGQGSYKSWILLWKANLNSFQKKKREKIIDRPACQAPSVCI